MAHSRTLVEKSHLLHTHPLSQSPLVPIYKLIAFVAFVILSATLLFTIHDNGRTSIFPSGSIHSLSSEFCPQTMVLVPRANHKLWLNAGEEFNTMAFKASAIHWLSGAIQIETETYDDMGPVGEDPRWENRLQFHDYLEKTFPLVHTYLKLEKINTYGLLYTWQGSDDSLKPSLLMAHFDVVPVNPDTLSDWAYPPYSGWFDGELIWGRGSTDDKGALIGIMGAMEVLLRHGFQPSRTLVAAFGFDEEGGGYYGAQELAATVLNRYGEDSFAFVIDEGGGFAERFGTVFATPGVAEKGYVNVELSVSGPGGHSSIPPEHTTIGILSALLVELETHPFEAHIERNTSSYHLFQCFAEHGTAISPTLRDAIRLSASSDEALREVEVLLFQDPWYKSLVGTTQAIDMVRGGVKSNALPEQAWAVVNHRIATTTSVNATIEHDVALLQPLAEQFELEFSTLGKKISIPGGTPKGNLQLTRSFGMEPAPVSPYKGDASAPYQLLAGTIKATYNAHRNMPGDSDNIVVGPGMPTGNTDTKYYWPLSRSILRYKHLNGGSSNNYLTGAHTVNESISADSLLETFRFYTTLILNADESEEF
ncbi:carboxypeptidase S [Lentinula raphanica]|uniref:Carboxypeptidase S n=1 Tax=Lentinula raphanica TaxID=153919 RepID=A0AA38UFB4_9AGAR|nr:carboxypeptidase S [Lentinula raphanica]KAJ3835997.1 carboxypeptidase S [Lentinula raphanica]KAJ3976049.1 carboxypeptidase S [Lentinula raphanica]